MHMSAAARVALVEAFEGFRGYAYRDSTGVETIGYGHTNAAGPPRVMLGMMALTREQADLILSRDLARVEAFVTRCVRVACRQREFDAMTDLAYNVGCGSFRSSTLLRLFNRGDRFGAADQFLRWNRAGGLILSGLTRRRRAERAWFLGVTPSAPVLSADATHAVDHPDGRLARAVNRTALALRRA